MAVAAYYSWDRLGRPLDPAVPIRDFVVRMKAGFPRAANLFSWYANEAHYQAEPPQDHTPFSATGWPQTSPFWWVFATDVMHRPNLGVDCNVLFAYWLGEAKAGRMPWLKYMIWQAKRYDVRNAWRPVTSSGHFDHVHLSARTDHRLTSLGSWDPTGIADEPGDDTMQCLIHYSDDPVPGRVWLADRMLRRVVEPAELVDNPADAAFLKQVVSGTAAANGPIVDLSGVLGPLSFGAKVYQTSLASSAGAPWGSAWGAEYPPAVTSTPGRAPTIDEIRTVVDEELDEQSRAGADTDDEPT